ncbi:MAG: Holliday junction branch migration DNA helicase RuvB [Planctomycetota bacterium]
MSTERIVSAAAVDPDEDRRNVALRPETMDRYIGQRALVEKLRVALRAAADRGEAMDHLLLHGPPGLGKTTLAHLVAAELDANLVVTSGPALTKPAELAGLLTKLRERDVLFVDEIHRMPVALEEYLYSAMEDFRIDVRVDSGMHARTVTLRLHPFTLVGATTRAGLLSGPMRSRFGLQGHLEFYPPEELLLILRYSAFRLGLRGASDSGSKASGELDGALLRLAERSRGTPRIANRLLRRLRDFAQVRHAGVVSAQACDDALALEGVDALGLDSLDRRYLKCLAEVYRGGPAGLEAIAASIAEDAGTLEQAVEPYLLQAGLLARTRRGRQLTKRAADHLGVDVDPPGGEDGDASADALFEG